MVLQYVLPLICGNHYLPCIKRNPGIDISARGGGLAIAIGFVAVPAATLPDATVFPTLDAAKAAPPVRTPAGSG